MPSFQSVGDIAKDINRVVRKTTQAVALNVVEVLSADPPIGTPIDTGHASSNWVATIGSPFQGVAGSRAAVTTAAQQGGIADLVRFGAFSSAVPPVFVVNNVHYIGSLNDGSSTKSPSGFVPMGIELAIQLTDRTLKL
jgi:hypothetical protein